MVAKPGAVLRFVLASVLLTAAALKAFYLATEPLLPEGVLTSRWFVWLTLEAEIGFGLWMLLGPYPHALRWAATLLFCGFGVVAFAKFLSGDTSCGCFGRVEVNPLWTGIFDLGAAVLLFLSSPIASVRPRSSLMRLAAVLGLWLLIGIPVGIAAATGLSTEVQAAGVSVAGNIVVLEPEKWLGKKLPVLSDVESGPVLARGDWILLFYHHDCPDCLQALPDYARLGLDWRENRRGPRIALVELPPFGNTQIRFEACETTRLSAEHEWFMATPCEIHIRDGVVQSVSLKRRAGNERPKQLAAEIDGPR